MIRIAINGFGRIGRAAFKIALQKKNMQVVAINDLGPTDFYAYLLQYDTAYGRMKQEVKAGKDFIQVGRTKYPKISEPELTRLPWKKYKVDVVLECTGIFVKDDAALGHIKAGAKKVIISAPSKGDKPFHTYVFGANEDRITKESQPIISNASCTTNCIAPLIAIMHRTFGVKKSLMTTVHAYTASQSLVDGGKAKDYREARAAAVNIVPSSTGAAIATTETIPDLKKKFDGISMRVPVITGSISDITMLLSRPTSVSEVNETLTKASRTARYRKILAVSNDPIVSTDIIGSAYSAIIDLPMTRVVDGDLVKVVAWYDNEWGYSNRLIEMAEAVMKS